MPRIKKSQPVSISMEKSTFEHKTSKNIMMHRSL